MPNPALIPDPNNANKGTVRGRGMLERSLQQYGAGRAPVASADGVIIAGNKTVEVARELGIPIQEIESDGHTLFVIRRTDLPYDDPRARELAIADNRVGQVSLDWDAEVLTQLADDGLDLEQFWLADELSALLAAQAEPRGGTEGLTDPDDVPEAPKVATTKPGDLWVLGKHRLICGDSTDPLVVAQLMDGKQADMVWTDPPYGVAIGDKNAMLDRMSPGSSGRVTRNLENDTLDEDGLRTFLRAAFAAGIAVCRPGAVWQGAAPPGPLHIIFGDELNRLGLWRQTIQWVKNNSTFSPLGVDYHWQSEPIFHGWVPGAAHHQPPYRKQTTVWEIDRPAKSPDHPTMKPVALVERGVTNHTDPGDSVLDLFSGSGTTILACEKSGRTGYAVELDPHYCDVAVRRWEEFTGLKAVHNQGCIP